jgi:hypothetical protein
MTAWLKTDDTGRVWVVDAEGWEYAGPYDTPEEALKAHPEAESEDAP